MNRWATNHAEPIERDLEAGERLLGANRALLVSASSIATWGTGTPVRGRAVGANSLATRRFAPHQYKLAVARQLGFPLPGWIFAIGLTDQRLLFWHTSRLVARPEELAASLPLDAIAAVRAPRRVGPTRLSIVLSEGGMLVVQAMWSLGLANIAREFDRLRASRDSG